MLSMTDRRKPYFQKGSQPPVLRYLEAPISSYTDCFQAMPFLISASTDNLWNSPTLAFERNFRKCHLWEPNPGHSGGRRT